MDLSVRKVRILEAIITDYIETAEPIGSRTIAKKSGLGVSSATIRNEMSDLEEMGLISQLHTSSGRVPSGKGYRMYVDSMMPSKQLSSEDAFFLQKMIMDNISQTEFMMQETAKALSQLTRYPAIVSEPYLKKTRIKHVQLVPLDEKSLLLVLVTGSKAVRTQVVNLQAVPGYQALTQLSFHLNRQLSGLSIKEIDRGLLDKMLHIFGDDAHMLMSVLGIISDMIQAEDDVRVFTSGIQNILAFPEFADIRKAEAIFQVLEDRASLLEILGQGSLSSKSVPEGVAGLLEVGLLTGAGPHYDKGIQIAIGEENGIALLKECSLVKANYSLDAQNTGSIALIGPMRMDYPQVVSVLSGILQNMQRVTYALGL